MRYFVQFEFQKKLPIITFDSKASTKLTPSRSIKKKVRMFQG